MLLAAKVIFWAVDVVVRVIKLAVGVGETKIEYSTLVQLLVAVIEMSSAVPVIMFYFLPFTFDMARVIADTSLDAQGSDLYRTEMAPSTQSDRASKLILANSLPAGIVNTFGLGALVTALLSG